MEWGFYLGLQNYKSFLNHQQTFMFFDQKDNFGDVLIKIFVQELFFGV